MKTDVSSLLPYDIFSVPKASPSPAAKYGDVRPSRMRYWAWNLAPKLKKVPARKSCLLSTSKVGHIHAGRLLGRDHAGLHDRIACGAEDKAHHTIVR